MPLARRQCRRCQPPGRRRHFSPGAVASTVPRSDHRRNAASRATPSPPGPRHATRVTSSPPPGIPTAPPPLGPRRAASRFLGRTPRHTAASRAASSPRGPRHLQGPRRATRSLTLRANPPPPSPGSTPLLPQCPELTANARHVPCQCRPTLGHARRRLETPPASSLGENPKIVHTSTPPLQSCPQPNDTSEGSRRRHSSSKQTT